MECMVIYPSIISNHQQENEVKIMDEFEKQMEKDLLFTFDRIRAYERNKAIDDFVKLAKEYDFKYGKKDITKCVIGFIEFFADKLKEENKEC